MKRALDLILLALCVVFLERVVFEAPSELEQGVIAGGVFVLLILMVTNLILDWKLRRRRRDLEALRSKGHRLRSKNSRLRRKLDELRQSRNPDLLN